MLQWKAANEMTIGSRIDKLEVCGEYVLRGAAAKLVEQELSLVKL